MEWGRARECSLSKVQAELSVLLIIPRTVPTECVVFRAVCVNKQLTLFCSNQRNRNKGNGMCYSVLHGKVGIIL